MKNLFTFLSLFLSISLTIANAQNSSLPIVHYDFSGNALDISGNQNHGELHGAELTTDRFGNENAAYFFDGDDDYISIAPVSDVSEIGDFTISVWSRLEDWRMQSGTDPTILDKHFVFDALSNTPTTTWDFYREGFAIMYQYSSQETDQIKHTTREADGTFYFNIFDSNTDLVQNWVHQVFIREGSVTYHYLNGELIDTRQNSTVSFDMQHPWYIGTFCGNNPHYGDYNYNFHGSIDDIRIYDRAITQEEVEELYGNDSGDLIAHYDFSGNALDISGNGNHGELHGAELTTDRFGNANSAYFFDGDDDYISIAPVSDVSEINDFSISVWSRLEEWRIQSGTDPEILDKQYIFDSFSNTSTTTWDFYRDGFAVLNAYSIDQTDEVRHSTIDVENGSFSNYFFNYFDYPGVVQNWLHHVFVREGGNTLHYVNGELIGIRQNDPAAFDMQHPWYIGTFCGNNPYYGDYNYNFHGKIDDIKIYNRAITEEEVEELYGSGGDLIAHYDFSGDALDKSGNQNHGELHGAELTTDRFGNANSAYFFDGDDDYISIAPVSDVSEINDFSISVWSRLEEWRIQSGTDPEILDKQYIFDSFSNTSTTTWDFYRDGFAVLNAYSIDQTDEVRHSTIDVENGSFSNYFFNYFDYPGVVQNWLHHVFVREGGNTLHYVNGELIGIRQNDPAAFDMQHPWYIGTFCGNNPYYGDYNYNFHGKIDDIKIYNRAITEEEVEELYAESTETSIVSTTGGQFPSNTSISIPVTLHSELTLEDEVYSFQFDYAYNPELLQFSGISTEGVMWEYGDISINETQTGLLSFSWSDIEPLIGSGDLVYFNFTTVNPGVDSLYVQNMTLQDTEITDIQNGEIIVEGQTGCRVSYSENPTTPGDILTISIDFDLPLLSDPTPQLVLSGANNKPAQNLTQVNDTVWEYTYTVEPGQGLVDVFIHQARDINNFPVLRNPTSGGSFVIESAINSDNAPKQSLNIYPNPAKDILHISANIELESYPIEIYNYTGQIVHSAQYSDKQPINISKLPAGLYFIKIKTAENNITKKFIKAE